jgi:hypothetical protein
MNQRHGCNCKENSWSAILDKMPPEPPRLTVKGICTCPTGGFTVSLTKAVPQGINPAILILDLETVAPTGIVNQMVTDYEVTYEEYNSPNYQEIEIRPCDIKVSVTVAS